MSGIKIPIYLEIGAKRTFASAIDWPGWSRGGRTENDAIAALLTHGPRYATVTARAELSFATPTDPSSLEAVERLPGNVGTDFGVPTLSPSSDDRPIDVDELQRLQALLRASWAVFDSAVRSAEAVELRKGPRGGGRDLNKIIAHVLDSDEAYLVQLGARAPKRIPYPPTTPRLREAILEALTARALGLPIAEASRVKNLWSPRYYLRRATWHVLDHAWEIEDRATGEPVLP